MILDSAQKKFQFSIFHFPFSIFHFPFSIFNFQFPSKRVVKNPSKKHPCLQAAEPKTPKREEVSLWKKIAKYIIIMENNREFCSDKDLF